MTDATKRRQIAEKLAADVARLQKEIADRRAHLAQAKARSLAKPHKSTLTAGWFEAWSRHAPAIARAEGALARLRSRLPKAKDKARFAEGQERKAAAVRATIRQRNVGLMRRLDAIKDGAAEVQAKWTRDRAEEEKRLNKIKKRLEQRTHKDLTAGGEKQGRSGKWWKPAFKLPPPPEQPTADVVVDAAPPREGLIPGTYRVVDPGRLSFALLDDEPLPPRWNARYVGVRLIEAHDVLRRMPASIWPKGYSAMWPAYKFEDGELAVQAGAGTLEVGRNLIVRTASSDEVARMDEALTWIAQYLSGCNPYALISLNRWAMDREADPDDKAAPLDLLHAIATALNAEHRRVT